MKNKKKITVFLTLIIFIIAIIGIGFLQDVKAQETQIQEMLIQVKSRMIELPDNQASIVPIRATRIRSEEIKTLNAQYNAKTIEKLFELKEKDTSPGLEIKGFKQIEKAQKQNPTVPVSVSSLFTKDIKKEFEEKSESVIEMGNVFLIVFETDVPVQKIVNSYKALKEVINAESIVRKK